MIAAWKIHHVGFVVDDIEQKLGPFCESVGGVVTTEIFHDPLQKVKVVFLQPAGVGPLIELVAPAAENSPVTALAAKGGGMHHLCYEVEDLDESIRAMRATKAILLRPAKPAVAFEGRRIAWLMTREKLLIELLEMTLSR